MIWFDLLFSLIKLLVVYTQLMNLKLFEVSEGLICSLNFPTIFLHKSFVIQLDSLKNLLKSRMLKR